MGIKEKDLQTVQSIEGGKLRCVTADGESRNIPADAIGGGSHVIPMRLQIDGGDYTLQWVGEERYADILAWVEAGELVAINLTYIATNVIEYGYCVGYYPQDNTIGFKLLSGNSGISIASDNTLTYIR